jgi:hypothetical protein
MIIERTDKEILIRIPNTVDLEGAQRIIDYINYQLPQVQKPHKKMLMI